MLREDRTRSSGCGWVDERPLEEGAPQQRPEGGEGPLWEDLGSGSPFQAGRSSSAKALRWEPARWNWVKPYPCCWLGNRGTERGGEMHKAMQLAEMEPRMCAEGTQGLGPLQASCPRTPARIFRLLQGSLPFPGHPSCCGGCCCPGSLV